MAIAWPITLRFRLTKGSLITYWAFTSTIALRDCANGFPNKTNNVARFRYVARFTRPAGLTKTHAA